MTTSHSAADLSLRALVDDVVSRDACTGCGLCTQLDTGLTMTLDTGYARPSATGPSAPVAGAASTFQHSCPGVGVAAQRPVGSRRHPLLGPYVQAWEAWATDDEQRLAGSSGGVLTALHIWLLSSGRAARIAGAAAERTNPRKSVPVTITTKEQALAAAGSRYAPVAALSNGDAFLPDSAVTAKPCEIAALRASREHSPLSDDPGALLLSFFCAGTPHQGATDSLLTSLGVPPEAYVDALRYRGNGWPGKFEARAENTTVQTDYEESWGTTLGPTTQWRCKVCADGVGESADIVAADSWTTDARGYPVFTETNGVSALIARTLRGAEVIHEAIAEGVITARPLEMDTLAQAQPLQTARRRFLQARLWGSSLAGRRAPRFRGFSLIRLGLRRPHIFIRTLRGTYRRVRTARRL